MFCCYVCKKQKSKGHFHKHSKRKSGVQTTCKECKKVKASEYYRKNKDKFNSHRDKYRVRNRDIVAEYLSNKSCVDCGNLDARVLQFDHVRGEKVNAVSKLVYKPVSVYTLMLEISKCEIRCANCHMIKTGKEFNWYNF